MWRCDRCALPTPLAACGQVIEPIAEILGVPKENIYANRILFNEDGSYKTFDVKEPTSRAGGKAKVVGMCVKSWPGHVLACHV